MNTVQTLGLIGGIIGVLSFIAMLILAVFVEAFSSFLGPAAKDVNYLYAGAGIGIVASIVGLTFPFQFKRGNGLLATMIIVAILVIISGSLFGILPGAIFLAASYKARAPRASSSIGLSQTIYCVNCGSEIISSAKFCSKCGTEVKV